MDESLLYNMVKLDSATNIASLLSIRNINSGFSKTNTILSQINDISSDFENMSKELAPPPRPLFSTVTEGHCDKDHTGLPYSVLVSYHAVTV